MTTEPVMPITEIKVPENERIIRNGSKKTPMILLVMKTIKR
jgi:hypothetical protein